MSTDHSFGLAEFVGNDVDRSAVHAQESWVMTLQGQLARDSKQMGERSPELHGILFGQLVVKACMME
jgi:hypothetical protein